VLALLAALSEAILLLARLLAGLIALLLLGRARLLRSIRNRIRKHEATMRVPFLPK